MPDHFFDELDRDEIDLFGDEDSSSIREALKDWLGYAPSPVQIMTAEDKVGQMRGIAASVGMTITTSRLREGREMVERTVLRDARGRFVRRGIERVRQFLEEEIDF